MAFTLLLRHNRDVCSKKKNLIKKEFSKQRNNKDSYCALVRIARNKSLPISMKQLI